MHLYYDHTVYSFHLYTFLWPEDGTQWPKHVVVSIMKQDTRQLCFDVSHPSLIAHNTTGKMHLKIHIRSWVTSFGRRLDGQQVTSSVVQFLWVTA